MRLRSAAEEDGASAQSLDATYGSQSRAEMCWIWCRALSYLVLIGGGWLVVLPAALLWWEGTGIVPPLRGWQFAVPGMILLCAGVVLACWAGFCLIQYGRGTPFPFDPTRELVRTGPYRRVRNPQAIAMTLMVCGEIALIDSAAIWLLLPLTIGYLEGLVGPREEQQLLSKHGSQYRLYSAEVPKWIPRRRRSQ